MSSEIEATPAEAVTPNTVVDKLKNAVADQLKHAAATIEEKAASVQGPGQLGERLSARPCSVRQPGQTHLPSPANPIRTSQATRTESTPARGPGQYLAVTSTR